jgi:hypothetical protein
MLLATMPWRPAMSRIGTGVDQPAPIHDGFDAPRA